MYIWSLFFILVNFLLRTKEQNDGPIQLQLAMENLPRYKFENNKRIDPDLSVINFQSLCDVQNIKKEEVITFSSYTVGLYNIIQILVNSDNVDITILLPQQFQKTIQDKIDLFSTSMVMSIDGVNAKIKEIKLEKNKVEIDQILVTANIAKQIFLNSSLIYIQPGNKVSIGLISKDPNEWLLNGEPMGTVILRNAQLAQGHKYVEEFTFECSQNQYLQILNLKYIGLNGSGFMIQRIEEQEKRYYFFIHAGRLTKEKTIFNCNTIVIGSECTLTLPFNPP